MPKIVLAVVAVLSGVLLTLAPPSPATTTSTNGIRFSVPTSATVASGSTASIKAVATSSTRKITSVRIRVWRNGLSSTYATAHLGVGSYQVAGVATWRATVVRAGSRVPTGAVHTTVSRTFTLTITAKPATTPQPVSTPASTVCYPLTNGGNCYEPGEYCRNSDHGSSGVAGDGEAIICTYNNGWRWEPA